MGIIIPFMGYASTSMGEVLFSKTRQRVFELLFGQPERSFYMNEIVRYVGAGIGSVHREMDRLEKSGLVRSTRIGNQKHYQANSKAPIFHEIRGIVLKTFGLAEPILKALEPVRDQLLAAFIYGSVANQSDTAESDIDLMIISDSLGFQDIVQALNSTEQDLGRSINPAIYGLQEWREKFTEQGGFVQRVMSKPKIFLVGSEDDLVQPG
jgi:predicted nucleotidyltransferase